MARKVEDSDEEFPDLTKLLSRKKAASAKDATSGTRLRGQPTPGAVALASTKREESRRSKIGSSEGDSRKQEEPKPKPKKHILNQTSDNPLLRPITSATFSKGSSQSLARSSSGLNAQNGKLVRQSNANVSDPISDLESGCEIKTSRRVIIKEPKKERTKTPRNEVTVDPNSDEEDYMGSSGLSDFVVNDSTFIEDESATEMPPRSVRRLVQGRRRRAETEDSDSEDLDCQMAKPKVEEDVFQSSQKASVQRDLESFANDYDANVAAPRMKEVKMRTKPGKDLSSIKNEPLTSDIDDPFTLSYTPVNKPGKVAKETQFITPPGSPTEKPKRLQSPKKQLPRIPSTPHRPSMDGFWQQDVINDWNDEYSPQKILQQKPRTLIRENTPPDAFPKKSPVKLDRIAREAKKAFSQSKHALAESFLSELDAKITNGEIAKLAASTGGVKVIWSKKLNTTAGRANWKRETIKPAAGALDGRPTHRHHAAIELAEKVIDDEERLLNVIAHEFCHLANFMVSNIKTNPHGKEFKAWAAKCSRHFGDRGIEVTTKHSYAIDYKYIWTCVNCSTEFKRHSKSIDPTRHQCGSCKSKLVQTKPIPRANAAGVKVSEYQLFVKENMKRLREENPGSPQKEIMGLVGKEYQVYKASKLSTEKSLESVDIEEDVGSKEGSPDDDVGDVVRKLDFLDLTSP